MQTNIQSSSQPISAQGSIYKLEPSAFWQWWQLSQSLKLFPKKIPDPFKNDALRAISLFLLMMPLQVGILFYRVLGTPMDNNQWTAVTRLVLLAGFLWLGNAWLFVQAFKRHQRILHQVIATESGLEVSSPFFKRKINWFYIQEVFSFVDIDTGIVMHQISCAQGESYLLSPQLTNCQDLIASIKSRISQRPEQQEELNYRLSDSFLDSGNMAIAAIFMVFAFYFLNAQKVPAIGECAVITAVLLALMGLRYLNNEKIPQLIRARKNEIFLQTRKQKYVIPVEQILQPKRLGSSIFFKTRANWFLLVFQKKEIRQRLLDNSNLKLP